MSEKSIILQTDNNMVVLAANVGFSITKSLMLQKHFLSVVAASCMRSQQKNSVALNDGLDGSNSGFTAVLFTFSTMQFPIVSQHSPSNPDHQK